VQNAGGAPIVYERLGRRINPDIESVRISAAGRGPENVALVPGGKTWVYPELQSRVGLRVKRKCIGEGRRIVAAKVAAETAAPGRNIGTERGASREDGSVETVAGGIHDAGDRRPVGTRLEQVRCDRTRVRAASDYETRNR